MTDAPQSIASSPEYCVALVDRELAAARLHLKEVAIHVARATAHLMLDDAPTTGDQLSSAYDLMQSVRSTKDRLAKYSP